MALTTGTAVFGFVEGGNKLSDELQRQKLTAQGPDVNPDAKYPHAETVRTLGAKLSEDNAAPNIIEDPGLEISILFGSGVIGLTLLLILVGSYYCKGSFHTEKGCWSKVCVALCLLIGISVGIVASIAWQDSLGVPFDPVEDWAKKTVESMGAN